MDRNDRADRALAARQDRRGTHERGNPEPPEPWRIINPYRGLLALEEQDADFFFGRDLETCAILDTIIAKPSRLIALIGNSGVGKSSLVQAGVVGSLKRQGRAVRTIGPLRSKTAARGRSYP